MRTKKHVDQTRLSYTMSLKRQVTLKKITDGIVSINIAVRNGNLNRAHDLRDNLYAWVVTECVAYNTNYTKQDIVEYLTMLRDLDREWDL